MTDYESRITVDLDGDKYSRTGFESRAVQTWHNLKASADRVDVAVSSGGFGLHFVAWFRDSLTFDAQLQIRRAAGDDPRRVDMDKQRYLNGLFTDVLFRQKDGRENTRTEYRDVWDALDAIDGRRDDHDRMKQVANAGHKGDPELARRV